MAGKSGQAQPTGRDGGVRTIATGEKVPRALFAPANTGGRSMEGSAGVSYGRDGGYGGIAGHAGLGQGTWLTSQQYKEYLDLLKQRTLAQQVVSVPMTPARYPGLSLGGGGNGHSPYVVNQPGYDFLAPRNSGKAAGYGGLPSPRTVTPPRKLP